MRVLERKTQGPDVKAWQEFLIKHGLLAPGNNTGTFGPRTEEATRQFQRQHALRIDGVVGPKTLAAASKIGYPVQRTTIGDQQTTIVGDQHLQTVHPELQRRIRILIDTVARRTLPITTVVVSGLRTFDEQRRLYAQGRKMPGAIVTNADAGFSNHNYGCACDLASWRNGRIDWNEADARIRGEIGQQLGLEMGVFWTRAHHGIHDPPHAQLTGGLSVTECLAIYSANGHNVRAVWTEVERRLASSEGRDVIPRGDVVDENCEQIVLLED